MNTIYKNYKLRVLVAVAMGVLPMTLLHLIRQANIEKKPINQGLARSGLFYG